MKAAIVFHSVCGNTYLVARVFEQALIAAGHQVSLLRVEDRDWVEKPGTPDTALAVFSAMRALPVARADDLLVSDVILMGCPVYFGNVSAQMKAFMDSTGGLWYQGKLVGRKFAAFVSAGNAEGGGDLALSALHLYAKYMGMLSLPLPVSVLLGMNANPLGIVQYSNGQLASEIDSKTIGLIERWSRKF